MQDLNIIIISHAMRGLVKNCIKSLEESLVNNGLNYQITVIDNYKKDDLTELINKKFPRINLLQIANKGLSNAINQGIKSIASKYYLVLNPDVMILQKKAIKLLYDFMEINTQVGLVAPKLINPDKSIQYSTRRFPSFLIPLYSRTILGRLPNAKKQMREFLMIEWDHQTAQPVDWILGAVMFIRKQALDQIGLFDERYFMYVEDTDFCRTLWENNWQVYYYPQVEMIHYHERGSANIQGLKGIFLNPLTRIHIASWIKYFYKFHQAKPKIINKL